MDKDIILKNYRALVVRGETVIGARGYKLFSYDLISRKTAFYAKVIDNKYSILSNFFLTKRFFRAEITNLYTLNDGSEILIAKKGLFKRNKDSNKFRKCFSIIRGSRPINLCITPSGYIFFGEYFSNFDQKAVHIYSSKDNGNSWDIVYTFNSGNINHIHGLFYDKYTQNVWVITGDRENECIIGYTSDQFLTFEEVFRGDQEFRSCNLLFYKEYIVYITDSQYIKNQIRKIDRKTLSIETLQEIESSCIYAGKNNKFAYVSTTIEPSEVNLDKYSHLYISSDGILWKDVAKYKKDIWHTGAFQFGSIQFPRYETNQKCNAIIFSGRALKKIDGKTVIMKYEF